MSLFEKRPLATVLSVFFLGSVFFFLFPTAGRVTGFLLSSLAAVLCFIFVKKKLFGVLLLAFTAAALLSFLYFDLARFPYLPYDGENVIAVGTVNDISFQDEDFYILDVTLERLNDIQSDIRVSATLESEKPLTRGDRLTLRGDFTLLYGRRLLEESMLYPISDGITAGLSVTKLLIHEELAPVGIHAFFSDMREGFASRIRCALPNESGNLLSTLLLGEWSVSAKTALHFRYAGILPLLAISGTHFTVLTFALMFLLKKLSVGKKARTLLLILFLFFYTALSGFLPSVVRAAIMLLVSLFGFLIGKPYDAITALLLSASVMLLCSPYLICSAGFLLSVTATFGILFCGEAVRGTHFDPFRIGHPLLFYLYSSLFVTASAILASLPVSAFLHEELSLLSFPANLLLSPLMSLLLFLSMAVLCLPFPPVTWVADILGSGILWAIDMLAKIPNMLLSLSPLPLKLLILVFVFLFFMSLALYPKEKAHPKLILSLLLCSLSLYIGGSLFLSHNACVYSYKSTVAGDYLLLSGGTRDILLDVTSGESGIYKAVMKDMKALSMTELSALCITHYTDDFPKGLRYLTKKVKLRTLYLPMPSEEESSLATEVKEICESRDILLVFYKPAAKIRCGGLTVTLYPESGDNRLFSVETDDEKLTYMTASYLESAEHASVRAALKSADVILFGAAYAADTDSFPYTLSPYQKSEIYISDKSFSEAYEHFRFFGMEGADVKAWVTEKLGWIYK